MERTDFTSMETPDNRRKSVDPETMETFTCQASAESFGAMKVGEYDTEDIVVEVEQFHRMRASG